MHAAGEEEEYSLLIELPIGIALEVVATKLSVAEACVWSSCTGRCEQPSAARSEVLPTSDIQ